MCISKDSMHFKQVYIDTSANSLIIYYVRNLELQVCMTLNMLSIFGIDNIKRERYVDVDNNDIWYMII